LRLKGKKCKRKKNGEKREEKKREREKKGKSEKKNWNVLFVSVFCVWAGTKFIDKRSAASCHPMTNSVTALYSSGALQYGDAFFQLVITKWWPSVNMCPPYLITSVPSSRVSHSGNTT